MIDFYTHGSQIGISIHGFSGFLLMVYIITDIVFLFTTKSLLIHKLFIWLRLRKMVKKILPAWWKIQTINPLTIEKVGSGYRVYIQVKNKINGEMTNDYIIVDYLGRIKKHKLTESMKFYDRGLMGEIKQWQRNKILENIGI